MLDILDAVATWQRTGTRVVVAVVVSTTSSTPLPVGSWMAIAETGAVLGSVSGGCVEGDVIEQAQLVLQDAVPRRPRYGVSDSDALAVGLTCGGTIEVLITTLDRTAVDLDVVRAATTERRPVAIAFALPPVGVVGEPGLAPFVVVDGHPEPAVTGTEAAQAKLAALAVDQLRLGRSGTVMFREPGADAAQQGFVQVFEPRPRLFVFGVSSFAVATARLGRALGFQVTVCDPRTALLTRERFPDADELVTEWPHRYLAGVPVDRRTAVCVLTHDAKYDLPVLEHALASDAGYVGAIGSRRTDVDRRRRLQARGVSDQQLARLRSPIGLDLGGRGAEEVALSILAEIVLLREGGSVARPLSAGGQDRSSSGSWPQQPKHAQRGA